MKIEQERIARTIVRITEDEAVQNFKECYQDVFMDSDKEDLPHLAKSYWDDCKNIVDRNYRKLFNDGMTMMLLGKDAFGTVDRFFLDKRRAERNNNVGSYKMELVVVIDCGDEMITVEEAAINY